MFTRTERPLKRELSVLEKATLPSTDGRVLLLPREPGNEIDEILEAGFRLEDIDAFELDKKLASELRDHYGGDLMVYDDDVFKHLDRTGFEPWSYIHLDLCGHMSFEDLNKIQRIVPNLADECRVRVTQYSSYRSKKIPWNTLAKNHNRKCWGTWYDVLLAANMVEPKDDNYHFILDHDPKLVLISTMLFAFGFGSSTDGYLEDFDIDTRYIPAIDGNFKIEDFQHLRYRDQNARNDMITVWFDLVKSEEQGKRIGVFDVIQDVIQESGYHKWHVSDVEQLMYVLKGK